MQDPQETEGRAGAPTTLAAGVQHGLEGAVFPLDRDRLVWVARENDARAEVLSALSGLPSGALSSLEHVLGLVRAQRPNASLSDP